jgi:hypothetical protein
MTHIGAIAIAAFFLGVGLAGQPFEPLHALEAGIVLAVLVAVLRQPLTGLRAFIMGFAGLIVTVALQHAFVGPSMHPDTFAWQLYFGVYPGTGVVALALGLLGAATVGRQRAPQAIAGIGTIAGIGILFLL